MEAKKLYNNIVTDLGVFILERFKVQSLEDFISHWKLKLREILFLVNSSSKVESSKAILGNNKLVVRKLWSAWSTSNGQIFFSNITFIFVFLTNSVLGFNINIPHIEFNFLASSICPMFSWGRRLFKASFLFLRSGAILKLTTPCIRRIFWRNG